MLIFSFHKINIHGRELNFGDFENMFKIGLRLDAYKPISFKLGMMIDTTKLYILIPLWMTLTYKKARACAIILL